MCSDDDSRCRRHRDLWAGARAAIPGATVGRQNARPEADPESAGQPFEKQIDTVYATKIGDKHPDQMYIVSGHMDSVNGDSRDQSFAPGADDDASGSSLVLEVARVFAAPDVRTEYSIRFIFWNAEEILAGSPRARFRTWQSPADQREI